MLRSCVGATAQKREMGVGIASCGVCFWLEGLKALQMATIIFVVAAYLIGSLSFAVIVSRLFALPDPHSYGSGNPGATNVLRTGKKLAAALTLAGDCGKGALAVLLARYFATDYGVDTTGVALVALAVFLGHVFPVFFRFRGGKGVATAFGILCAVNLWLGLATLASWLVIVLIFRMVSLASIIAAVFAPLYTGWLFGSASPLLPAVLAIAALLVYRHRENIRRLLAGQESRIGTNNQDSA
jgi:glycerol-3-phosphate acyltransferase PlsY